MQLFFPVHLQPVTYFNMLIPCHCYSCIELEPGWAKGHVRRAAAYRMLGQWPGCSRAYMVACYLEPNNKELQESWRDSWDKTVSLTSKQLGMAIDFILVTENLEEIDIRERKLKMLSDFPGYDVFEGKIFIFKQFLVGLIQPVLSHK